MEPQEIRSIFFGASLCALRKKDGGVRPIAIGNTLALISKVAVRGWAETCSNVLRPNQLGFGVRVGAEAAVHATCSFIESHCDNTVVLKIDFLMLSTASTVTRFSQLQVNICQACSSMCTPRTEHRPSSPLETIFSSPKKGSSRETLGSSSVLPYNTSHRETSLFSTQFVVPQRWDLGGFSFSSASRLQANSVRGNPCKSMLESVR